jgi:hypothetical protein
MREGGCARHRAGRTRAASAPTSSTPREMPTSIDHDGLFRVGTDMSPGLWHTDGGRRRTLYNGDGTKSMDSQCHWAAGAVSRTERSAIHFESNRSRGRCRAAGRNDRPGGRRFRDTTLPRLAFALEATTAPDETRRLADLKTRRQGRKLAPHLEGRPNRAGGREDARR